jgi:hypothetical protein
MSKRNGKRGRKIHARRLVKHATDIYGRMDKVCAVVEKIIHFKKKINNNKKADCSANVR